MAAVARNPVFKMLKLALLTGNTWEALQFVILHEKDTDGGCLPSKLITLDCTKMVKLFVLYVGVYGET